MHARRRAGIPSRQSTHHRDNRSAFFSCLPLRAKSATVEILVSGQCERRPPLLIGGRFDSGSRATQKFEKLQTFAYTRAPVFSWQNTTKYRRTGPVCSLSGD